MFRQAVLPPKRNPFAHAVEVLGGRILRGDLKHGEILPNEAELGRELGASRTVVSFRISSRLYDAGLPLHNRVLDAIRDRHPEQARENMAMSLSNTREFLERVLAGPVHYRVDEARPGGGLRRHTINAIFMKGTQIAETKLSIRKAPERTGKKEKAGRKTPAQSGEDRATSVGLPGAGAG